MKVNINTQTERYFHLNISDVNFSIQGSFYKVNTNLAKLRVNKTDIRSLKLLLHLKYSSIFTLTMYSL